MQKSQEGWLVGIKLMLRAYFHGLNWRLLMDSANSGCVAKIPDSDMENPSGAGASRF